MKEPAFLKEIHEHHLREYKNIKNKSLKKRLKSIQQKANMMKKSATVSRGSPNGFSENTKMEYS